MANILFGVTGSVAAIRTPLLFERLRQAGHAVKVVATRAALYFFDPAELDSSHAGRNPQVVVLDEDEWPGQRWQRDDPVLHIELRRWADLFLIAPLDANTLAKLAHGLSDNCLTCVWRAWDPARPVVLAPAMNTLMWENRLTAQHLLAIAANAGAGRMPSRSNELSPEAAIQWVNDPTRQIHLRIVPPISKKLACGDVGIGALAELDQIVNDVQQQLA
jgi:phosphopantothenoylcysteine decarboxylase